MILPNRRFFVVNDHLGLRVIDYTPLPDRYIAGPFTDWNSAGCWMFHFRTKQKKQRKILIGLAVLAILFGVFS